MPDDVAADFQDLAYGPPSPFGAGTQDGETLYGPPSPGQSEVADGTVYGPPVPGAATPGLQLGPGTTAPGSGTASSGSDFDVSGIIQAGINAAGQVAKTVGQIATPFLPKPQIPTPPAPPNLPAPLPVPSRVPPVPRAPGDSPGSAKRADPPLMRTIPGLQAPANTGPQAPVAAAKPGMSTGAKVAIGLGLGGVVVGGGLLIAASGKKKSR